MQAGYEPVFEFPLLHRLSQAEEVETVGTLKHFISLFGKMLRQGEIEVVCLLLRHRAFVSTCFDLIEQYIA